MLCCCPIRPQVDDSFSLKSESKVAMFRRCERGLKPATTCLAETLWQYVAVGFRPRLYPSSTALPR